MKNYKNRLTVLMLLSITLFSFKVDEKVKDWFLAGSNSTEYEIGIITDKKRSGNVAFLKSISTKVKAGFGTIMQTFYADKYNGERVKLSGYIKSEGVKEWAGMWMRVDGQKETGISFDNMQDRPIKGSNPWKKYEIILDVPKNSKSISYGVLLSGVGKVWLDSLTFEIVGKAEMETGREILAAPSNTNFENN